MRATAFLSLWILIIPTLSHAQTEGVPAIARDVFSREVRRAAVPPVVVEERVVVPPRRIVTDRVIPQRVAPDRVVTERIVEERVVPQRVVTHRVAPDRTVEQRVTAPAAIAEQPVVRDRVVATSPAPLWWDVLTRARFGYYDDAYFDDNWYYDYYEAPPVTVRTGEVVQRTGWFYAPTAERGLFNWSPR
jgi:hypothetical protein